jgi:protein involved in polysaccharide export with SLBB domain
MQGSSDVMRAGDKITIRLSGTPDNGFIMEQEIPENGQITVPYLNMPFQAAGRTTGALAADITQAYKTQRIYITPDVTVIPEERFVSVGGEVRSPTRVLYTPDLTVVTAINSCGGFTDYAKRNAVRVIRGSQVIYVNCVKASADAGADVPVYPGDQIYVPRTIF